MTRIMNRALRRAAPTALLFSGFLSGCFVSDGSPEQPLAVSADYLGAYTVSGDRMIMVTQGDTASWCAGSERRITALPAEVDTLEFSLAGDRLVVLNSPEADGPADANPRPMVRIAWEAERVGRGSGLEGHWRIRRFDHQVVSGALGDSLARAWKDRIEAWRVGNSLGVSEIEFREGRAYARKDIRWADLFLAEWNGDLDPAVAADSALLDIDVKVLDKYTVELAGRKTGEAVRVAFDAKTGLRSYSSSAPNRPVQAEDREPGACSQGKESWFPAFLAENARG
jgi:hypothetical protein